MPVTPLLVAITLVLPSATAVASPVPSMAATLESLSSHVNVASAIKLSFASNACAAYCCVVPKDVSVAVAGITFTESTA